jgi:hypothetical protein
MKELTLILCEATKAVLAQYFQLPVAGQENPIYRERVYCYELYHHIRTLWPDDTRYSLGGEVDKSGHPLIRGNGLDRTKPDLLVHVPGDTDNNELVMEIKPVNAHTAGIKKDLRTLTAYRRNANYRRAILLVYGGLQKNLDRFRLKVRSITERDAEGSIDLRLIELWQHGLCGQAAARVRW